MPAAARVTDTTNHGGIITGPGVKSVLIKGKLAAVQGDTHVCSLPPNGHQPTTSAFAMGSKTVKINGRSALRITDTCACGAQAVMGEQTVNIGG